MKNDYEITLKLSGDMMKKFLFVSEKEGRTPANQFLFMLRGNIAYYEKTKGRLKPSDLTSIDITPYESKN
ncbi:MAG: hypothetical protein U0M06_07110 [Clostridia bacterium]|nr:hypothetical protein [Clostridia bacterium]